MLGNGSPYAGCKVAALATCRKVSFPDSGQPPGYSFLRHTVGTSCPQASLSVSGDHTSSSLKTTAYSYHQEPLTLSGNSA